MRSPSREREHETIEIGNRGTSVPTNSEEFPAHLRPSMFHDDRVFNRLPFKKAASVVWDHQQALEKKREQQQKKSQTEKTDDKLPLLDIPASKTVSLQVLLSSAMT